ncbi:MAG: hypothetical protein MMC23_001288 [Stictis urceolatum]|nr:hypothetical protein [Stictis urceolata]
MATLTDNDRPVQPICQNCQTSTTPLWRRDELGSVLCNACGLFLKLHGRPRPISLKTDVIKSRNRVKSSGQAIKKAAKALLNGVSSRSEAGTPPPGLRRVSQKSGSDRSISPISRTTTPALHHPTAIAPQQMFDTSHIDHRLSHSPSLPALHFRQPSPGSLSIGDRHLEPPQTYESLQQANTQLKTQVSELEVINGLYKGRVQELERAESMNRQALEQSRAREDDMKRRLEELEHYVADLRKDSPNHNAAKRRLDGETLSAPEQSPPYAKRTRLSDVSQYTDPPQPPPT